MPYDPSGSRESFHAWLEDALAASLAGTEAAFATLDVTTGKPVGSTRYLALRPEHRGLEIGWTWLTPAHWQTGANVEAKLLMLEHAFERRDLRVEFKTDSRNERSRAPSAASARFEGIFRKHMLVRGGERRDSAYYSIVDDEWPEVRENLWRRIDAIQGGDQMSEGGTLAGRRRVTVAEAMRRLPGAGGSGSQRCSSTGAWRSRSTRPRHRPADAAYPRRSVRGRHGKRDVYQRA